MALVCQEMSVGAEMPHIVVILKTCLLFIVFLQKAQTVVKYIGHSFLMAK